MALPTVHISKGAFLVMLWSAIENFKKECVGFVLGYRPSGDRNHYFVTDAIPFQRLRRRKNTEADISMESNKRFSRFLLLIENLYPKYLGDFHSHPEWGQIKSPDLLSDSDLEALKNEGYDLDFIISVSSRKKGRSKWETLADGSIKGSFDRYNFQISVYTIVEAEGEKVPQRLKIVATRAFESLNRIE